MNRLKGRNLGKLPAEDALLGVGMDPIGVEQVSSQQNPSGNPGFPSQLMQNQMYVMPPK